MIQAPTGLDLPVLPQMARGSYPPPLTSGTSTGSYQPPLAMSPMAGFRQRSSSPARSLTNGMQQMPLTNGMQQMPMTNGIQQMPMTNGMQQMPMTNGMQQMPMTDAIQQPNMVMSGPAPAPLAHVACASWQNETPANHSRSSTPERTALQGTANLQSPTQRAFSQGSARIQLGQAQRSQSPQVQMKVVGVGPTGYGAVGKPGSRASSVERGRSASSSRQPVPQVPDVQSKNAKSPLVEMACALEAAEENRTLRQGRLSRQTCAQIRYAGLASKLSVSRGPLRQSLASKAPLLEWWEKDGGPRPDVTTDALQAIIRSLSESPDTLLSAQSIGQIFSKAAEMLYLQRHEPISRVRIPEAEPGVADSGRLIVLGDTHGQLEDVLWIFRKHGNPSKTNVYLFNGDIADRGPRALEIYTLALGFLIACPGSVLINRGSHEDEVINRGGVGGFYDECLAKYGGAIGGLLYDQIRRIYALLPVATIIGNSVFVVHGGLSRHVGLLSSLEAYYERRSALPAEPWTAQEEAIVDAVWSDPMDENGLAPSARGPGLLRFGPDVTESFLRETGLSIVVRSHEVPKNLDGVYSMHGNRLITVFSASNYCGTLGNQGAVLIFYETAGRLSYDVSRHFAPSFESGAFREIQPGPPLAAAQVAAAEAAASQFVARRDPQQLRLQKDILGQIARIVVEYKPALWTQFFARDTKKRGYITAQQWREACRCVLGELPWSLLQSLLMVENPVTKEVDYSAFVNRFRVGLLGDEVSDLWAEAFLSRVYKRMLIEDKALREFIARLDPESTGQLTQRLLIEALTSINLGITALQADALIRTMQAHAVAEGPFVGKQSRIDVQSFLSRFDLIFRPLAEKRNAPEWVGSTLRQLGKLVWTDAVDEQEGQAAARARAFFEAADTNNDGLLDYTQFAAAILQLLRRPNNLQFELSEKEATELAKWVDSSGDGHINYLEFLQGFMPSDMVFGQAFHVDLTEHICTIVWANKSSLLSALLLCDETHSGFVTRQQLVAALRALNVTLNVESPPLTEEQILILVDHTHFDSKTGKVSYRRFLDSFQVFDMAATSQVRNASTVTVDASAA